LRIQVENIIKSYPCVPYFFSCSFFSFVAISGGKVQ
jgi:hypothetical protein